MTKSQTWRIYSVYVMYCSEQIREEKCAKLKTIAERKGQKDWPGGFLGIAKSNAEKPPVKAAIFSQSSVAFFHVTETNNE